MDELGPDEQRWLDVLRVADEPTAEDRRRVLATVTSSVAGAGVGAAAAGVAKSGAVAKAAGTATVLTAGWKIGLAVVALGVAGAAAGAAMGFGAGRAPEALPASHAAAANAAAPETSAESQAAISIAPTSDEAPPSTPTPGSVASPSVPAAEPSTASSPRSNEAVAAVPPKGASRTAAPRSSHPRAVAHDVEAELALLTQAQRALERGDASGALTVLGRHGREHPRGALAVEREGLRAIASCEAKRSDGPALAQRFVAQNPTSPLVARVKGACLSP